MQNDVNPKLVTYSIEHNEESCFPSFHYFCSNFFLSDRNFNDRLQITGYEEFFKDLNCSKTMEWTAGFIIILYFKNIPESNSLGHAFEYFHRTNQSV